MGTEIERKFLVNNDDWRGGEAPVTAEIVQGYLPTSTDEVAVRVRLVAGRAWLTVKGPARGARRDEFEYEIPQGDARRILESLCIRPPIEKTRHRVEHAGMTWEIDVFHGENHPLVLAEVEIEDESTPFEVPGWVGTEVTEDARYTNAHLASHPFSSWAEDPHRG